MNTIINYVLEASNVIQDGRTLNDILNHTTQELGELATEISIHNGFSQKEPGADGIIGEAVDVIICALDIIGVFKPDISSSELQEIFNAKVQKWIKKAGERANVNKVRKEFEKIFPNAKTFTFIENLDEEGGGGYADVIIGPMYSGFAAAYERKAEFK